MIHVVNVRQRDKSLLLHKRDHAIVCEYRRKRTMYIRSQKQPHTAHTGEEAEHSLKHEN